MTDCEIILSILSDYKPHNVINIMQIGKPGCINWAVRSRISDLKKKGHNISSRVAENGQAEYTLKGCSYKNDSLKDGAYTDNYELMVLARYAIKDK